MYGFILAATYADFFQFWAAGRIVAGGGDPYNHAAWLAVHTQYSAKMMDGSFIYPMPLALVFTPLGLLEPQPAFFVFALLSIVELVFACWLLCKRNWIMAAALAVAFLPTMQTLAMGHLGALLLLAVAMFVHSHKTGRPIMAGLALAALAIKPHVGLPVIGLVSLWFIFRKQYRTPLAALAGVAALVALGMAYNPEWPISFVQANTGRLVAYSAITPTIFGMAAYSTGSQIAAPVLWGMFSTLLMFGYLFVAWRAPFEFAVSTAVFFALLIVPYLWPYDHILMVATLALALDRSSYPTMAALAWIGLDVFAIAVALAGAAIRLDVLWVYVPFVVYVVGENLSCRVKNRCTQPIG